MKTDARTIEIELEDVAGTSWVGSLLSGLTGQNGMTYMRFVARVDDENVYRSPTFVVPRTFGRVPPDPSWAPDMGRCLDRLGQALERDGWTEQGKGEQEWSLRYTRG